MIFAYLAILIFVVMAALLCSMEYLPSWLGRWTIKSKWSTNQLKALHLTATTLLCQFSLLLCLYMPRHRWPKLCSELENQLTAQWLAISDSLPVPLLRYCFYLFLLQFWGALFPSYGPVYLSESPMNQAESCPTF